MSEGGWQALPEELELMVPGPRLAALLASVDRRLLSGGDRVRLVQARNRLIAQAPGCRRPARSCDLDHTVAKGDGGHSGPSNMGSLCRLHHRFKHSAGVDLISLGPGCFGWSTPRGMQYTTTPYRPMLDPAEPTGGTVLTSN